MVPVDGVPWRQFWRLVFRPFSYTGWTTWPWTFNIFSIFQRYLMEIFRTCYTVRIFIRDGDTRSVSDIHSLPLVFHWNKEDCFIFIKELFSYSVQFDCLTVTLFSKLFEFVYILSVGQWSLQWMRCLIRRGIQRNMMTGQYWMCLHRFIPIVVCGIKWSQMIRLLRITFYKYGSLSLHHITWHSTLDLMSSSCQQQKWRIVTILQ